MPKSPEGVYRRAGHEDWSWRVQWREPGGPRRSLSGSGCVSVADAVARRSAALAEAGLMRGRGSAELAPWAGRPLGDFLGLWLESRQVKATTLATYRSVCGCLASAPMARVPLRRVSEAHLVAWVRSETARGVGHDTVLMRLGVLRRIFAYAVRLGLLAQNPAAYVKVVRQAPRQAPGFWDTATATRFLAACAASADPLYPLYRLALVSGLRRGELLGLHWADVDLAKGCLYVRRNRTLAGTEVVETTPKTASSEAAVPVDAETLRLLGRPGLGHVFRTPTAGGPWHPTSMIRRFVATCAEHGAPVIRFHGLRHSAASIMAEAGVPLAAAQERLRHWSPAMTATYTHVSAGRVREVADLMGAVLAGPAPGSPPGGHLRLVSGGSGR